VNKESVKQYLYTFGKLLGVLGLLFVLYKLYVDYTLESFINSLEHSLPIIFPLLVINVIATMIGIIGWHTAYAHYADRTIRYITTYYFFSKTEIAKYLPGNVFHFLGRQALASQMGISQKNMAQASLYATMVLCVATVFSTFVLALVGQEISSFVLLLLGLVVLGSMGVIFFMYRSFSIRQKLKMLGVLSISIALQGVMLGLVVWYMLPEGISLSLFMTLAAIYILSWLVGFVTPGASGGLGVREGAFIAIASYLDLSMPTDVVVFAVLLVRLINILGDTVLYISTYYIKDPFGR
jgi:hypothetical protein